MSRFYGSIEGSAKTAATRRGHTNIDSHTRGWSSGIRVVGSVRGDVDCFDVYATAGSNGGHSDILLGTLRDGVFTPTGANGLPDVASYRGHSMRVA